MYLKILSLEDCYQLKIKLIRTIQLIVWTGSINFIGGYGKVDGYISKRVFILLCSELRLSTLILSLNYNWKPFGEDLSNIYQNFEKTF